MSTQPVGSLTEEAAKLLAVLQGWTAAPAETSENDPDANTSHDPDGSECRWCPHCRLVRAAKATSPEAREHLTHAATSFALAVQELLATTPEPAERAEDSERTERTERAKPVPKRTKPVPKRTKPVAKRTQPVPKRTKPVPTGTARASTRDVPIQTFDLAED